jgi:hypothetical protein
MDSKIVHRLLTDGGKKWWYHGINEQIYILKSYNNNVVYDYTVYWRNKVTEEQVIEGLCHTIINHG